MREIDAERAARLIVNARTVGACLERLPTGLEPQTIEDGYLVQSAIRALWRDDRAGWKIGATAKAVQDMYRLDEPFYGPVYRGNIHDSPGRVAATQYPHRCIETEFTLRLGSDLPASMAPFNREMAVAAIDAVIPSFEIISPRFETILTESPALAVADCALNGGLVLGRPVLDWPADDVARLPARLIVDGVLREEGTGARALGDPLDAFIWLANALACAGLSLTAGDIVATGTCTGVHWLEPGQSAVGDFGPLGTVELRFD